MKKHKDSRRLIILILILLFMISVFAYGLKRIGMFSKNPYSDEISASANLFGVDPLLVEALMKRESNMNPAAVSSKGAVGLMQIMPKTAQEISEQIIYADYNNGKLNDPMINTMFGTYYLAKLLSYYNNNLILALAAYNAGIGNVDKWKELDPDIAGKITKIPFRETRRHVRGIIITYNFYKIGQSIKTFFKPAKNS